MKSELQSRPPETPELPKSETDSLAEAGANELSNADINNLFPELDESKDSEIDEGEKPTEKPEDAGFKSDDNCGKIPINVDELKKDPVTKDAANFIEKENINIHNENLPEGTIAEARDNNGSKEIVFNEEYLDSLSPEEKKATVVHEVEHLKGGDEYDARKAEADTGYSQEAEQLIYNEDGSLKDKNKVKDDLIQEYDYNEDNFSY